MVERYSSADPPSIGERVRFWEEQDKINQELIPRVIRQHELLTAHIGDHENLPLIAGNAINEALATAREEQQRRYEAQLAEVKAEGERQARQYEVSLEEQRQRYEAELAQVKAEGIEQARLYEAARNEQSQQYETRLAEVRAEVSEQVDQNVNQGLATLQQQARQTRNLVLGVATGATAISIASVIIAILT